MNNYIFTDLACEISGERNEKRERFGDNIEKICFSEAVGGALCRYVTFFAPRLWLLNDREFSILKREISKELRIIIDKHTKGRKCLSILAVGLGNPRLTSDALGVRTVDGIWVTMPQESEGRRIMAIAPDVSGNTGIDTLDAVKAYVDTLMPDVVIAIDSLRARGYERLASTVQLSDRGIIPGGGIGGGRAMLSGDTLGVPIISIGVPTVVSASTVLYEAVRRIGAPTDSEELSALLDNGLDFFVMPKEADVLIKSAALLISNAINSALSDM